MDKYLALGDYKPYVIYADDWESAVWQAEEYFGSALYSITKIPKGEEDEID